MSDFQSAVVRWIDSPIVNEQSDDLPKPTVIESVGWLVEETDDYVVIVRDHHTNSDGYRYRGACAIPRSAILALVRWWGVKHD